MAVLKAEKKAGYSERQLADLTEERLDVKKVVGKAFQSAANSAVQKVVR